MVLPKVGTSPASLDISRSRASCLPPDGLLCNYTPHLCHGQRLQGYEFCIKHILEDKTAPYRPCAYTAESQSGVRACPRAAPRSSRGESYCREHSRALVSGATRRIVRKRGGAAVTAVQLQDSLAHYKRSRTGGEAGETRLGQVVLAADRLEESEEEVVRVGDTFPGDGGDSEPESVDSESEESLKHAGVFTGEEVMRTMRDKLIRLQKLYIEQFGRLGHLLRESRRTYLAQVKDEREAGLMNMSQQPGDQQTFSKLKALTHYHCPAGREALLAARLRDKRAAVSGGSKQSSGASSLSVGASPAPCQHHLTSSTKCGQGVVPMSRFCPRHVLQDTNQVLFRQCGALTNKEDGPCEVPVPAIFSHTHCVFHVKLQPALSRPHPASPEENNSDNLTDNRENMENMENKDIKIEIKTEGVACNSDLTNANTEAEAGERIDDGEGECEVTQNDGKPPIEH